MSYILEKSLKNRFVTFSYLLKMKNNFLHFSIFFNINISDHPVYCLFIWPPCTLFVYLKFGDGDEVKKVVVSSIFIEKYFGLGWPGLVNSRKKMLKPQEKTNKKDYLKLKKLGCQMDKRETNSDHEMEKR